MSFETQQNVLRYYVHFMQDEPDLSRETINKLMDIFNVLIFPNHLHFHR